MRRRLQNVKRGFTIIELMVTILIVACFACIIAMFFVNLLTIQEKEREDAYVREKLADICAEYAELLSVGSSFVTNEQGKVVASYPHEAGGVSLEFGGNYETGIVFRVASLTSSVQRVGASYAQDLQSQTERSERTIDVDVSALNEKGHSYWMRLLSMHGDAELLPVQNCTIQGLNFTWLKTNQVDCLAMGLLEITASYEYKDKNRNRVRNKATARRVVRLWNGE